MLLCGCPLSFNSLKKAFETCIVQEQVNLTCCSLILKGAGNEKKAHSVDHHRGDVSSFSLLLLLLLFSLVGR
jgi:hypothetical protein